MLKCASGEWDHSNFLNIVVVVSKRQWARLRFFYSSFKAVIFLLIPHVMLYVQAFTLYEI